MDEKSIERYCGGEDFKSDLLFMKILIIASYAESLRTFRGPLLESLIGMGNTVHVAAPLGCDGSDILGYFNKRKIVFHEFPLQRTGINPLHDLYALWNLFLLLRKESPDLMLAYTIKPIVWGGLAAWLARVPRRFALITGLGYSFSDGQKGLLNHLVSLLYRTALRRVEKVFFQNPDDELLFRRKGVLPPHIPSVVVNGSGIDLERFPVSCLPDGTSFLLIARLLGDKGIREYIEAARKVKKLYPDTVFRLVGWIDENPDAISRQELDGWVQEAVIEYLGKLSDVRPAIADSSIYVLPSYREGTPRTVLEAMSMGRPIITTDAPGCRETVIDGINGFLVPVKSVDSLAEAMLRFIQDPSLTESMGRASRKIAEEKYDVHKVNQVMLTEMGITPHE